MPDGSASWALAALDVGREEVRSAVEDVLSRPPYAELRREGLRAWIAEVRRRLAEWLGGVLGQEGTAVVSWVILVVAVLLVLLLALRWARRLTRDPAATPEPLDGPSLSHGDWLAEAARLADAGDLREATRAAFRGVVAAYAEAGIVEEIPGTTVGEYRARVRRDAPSAAASFDGAADVFEAVWYGHREPTAEGLERVMAATRRVRPVAVP